MSDGKFLFNCLMEPTVVGDAEGNVSVSAESLQHIINLAHRLRVDALFSLMKGRARRIGDQSLSLAAVDAEEKTSKIYGDIKELCESLDSLLPAPTEHVEVPIERPDHPLARLLTIERQPCCDSAWMSFIHVTPPCTKCTTTEGRTDYLFQDVKMCWPCYVKTKADAEAARISNIEKELACQCAQLLVDGSCSSHGPLTKLCKCGSLGTVINDNGVECLPCAEDLYA